MTKRNLSKSITFLVVALLPHVATNGQTSPPPDGHNELDLKLKIISVPDYVFAAATYATPVKYRIEGCDQAIIGATQVTFAYEGKSVSKDISGLFVAEDGPEQANGSTVTYTAIVPPEIYQDQLCHDHKTPEAQFNLIVTVTPIVAGKKYETVTLTSEKKTGKVGKRYVDEKAFCVEIPVVGHVVNEYEEKLVSLVDNAYVSQPGKTKYTNLSAKEEIIPNPDSFADSTSFNDGKGLKGLTYANARISMDGSSLLSECHLTDELPGVYGNVSYQAESLGLREGCSFFISYGGKVVDSKVYGGPVMDLACTSGTYTFIYCKGKAVIKFGESQTSNLGYFGKCSGLFGIGWALAPVPYAAAFGTISSVFAIMAAIDTTPASNSADAIVTAGVQFSNEIISEGFPLQKIYAAPGIDITCGDYGRAIHVGEQFSPVVQVDSSCVLKTLPENSFAPSNSYAKAAFYSTESDLRTITIFTYR
jgi:hypothetical protein